MPENYSNNYSTTLNGAINNSQTTLTLTSATNAPTAPFRILIDSEVIWVATRVGTACSGCIRGYEGTAAASHLNLANIYHVFTAGTINDLRVTGEFKGRPWFDVRAYGALGDGVTDDTAAINSAITALNAVGRGTLYFPAGKYISTGGHVLPNQTVILGEGEGTPFDEAQYVSMVVCTSATAVLFQFSLPGGRVERIAFDCSAVATAGAGVQVTNTLPYFLECVDFVSVRISRFYIGVDIQVGSGWMMFGCTLYKNVLYNMKIQNTQAVDSGDWSIASSQFVGAAGTATSIRIESSGGGKIWSTKINNGINGIDLAVGTSVATGILLISNCSLENLTGDAIHGTTSASASTWHSIAIQNNQFGLWTNTGGHAISLVATTAGDFSKITISNNVLIGAATSGAAIILTKCDLVNVTPHNFTGFPALMTLTTCTNVRGTSGENGVIAKLTAAIAIANTETSIISGTIPAGFLRVGTTCRFTAYGRLTSGVTPGSSVISIRASATFNYYVQFTIPNAASKTNAPFKIEGLWTVRTLGASGTAIGEVSIFGGTAVVPFTLAGDVSAVSAAVAVDSTVDCPVFLNYISGNAGTTATFETAIIEVLNAA